MLAESRLKELQNWASSCTKEELIWVNGYLSGLLTVGAEPSTTGPAATGITIAYGTETGNAQKLATALAAKVKKSGLAVKLTGMDQYRPTDLAKEAYFFAIISTHGEGEPPAAAKKFYDHIHKNGFQVPNLRYGVLALGDSSYPLFCKTGEDVDQQLQQLGGTRLLSLRKCDVDYEAEAEQWFADVLALLANNKAATTVTPTAKKAVGKKIYEAEVLCIQPLTGRGSSKTTYHIELAVPDVDYLPGDSIAVVPPNSPAVVNEVLALTGANGSQPIHWKNEEGSLAGLLLEKIGISYLTEKAVQQYAAVANQSIAPQRADLLYLLRNYPIDEAALLLLLPHLNAIAPRIYNIASAPAAHGGEVHITVQQDVFTANGQTQTGLCSQYFGSLQTGSALRFFVQPNKRFRLPDSGKDIIMIGPGTGIAPFRSFVAARDASGATGRNWLFFADTDFTTDFYYQTEWQAWFNTGVLTKVSLAFAHNHHGTATVQDKIRAQGAELFAWLQGGAHLYLCGEKEPMAKEVEAALLEVFAKEGGYDGAGAQQYFEQLKTEGRYAKDVY
jgi:sulfite reductase (NADPH) flavoprotein alpha-component